LNQQISVDGLFEIVRAKPAQHAPATSRLVLVCRGGRLFGADPEGRVCLGRLLAQKQAVRMSTLNGTYEIPQRRPSSRHPSAHPPSVQFPITGEVDPLARSQNVTICIGVRKIDIQITYLGPLPP
jgi:hypothetical protein